MKTIIIDGVEYDLTPKALFKKGDWITNGKLLVGQVTSFDGEYYHYIQEGIEQPLHISNAYNWHLWTIEDAKDGDVLVCESGWTCIFKTLVNDETFSSYCFMDDTKWFCETGSECHTLKEEFVKAYNGKIHPATKEQRDLLFQKMKEAGYEWDAEKKELNKIEQKLVESDWVDLGLPSGTLWKSSNEINPKFYTYDEAMQLFFDLLPTKEQWEELKNTCQWTWTGNGYKATGPNGNSIFLPAAGYRFLNGDVVRAETYGSYWASKPNNLVDAWSFDFNRSEISIYTYDRCIGQSVRLVNSIVH